MSFNLAEELRKTISDYKAELAPWDTGEDSLKALSGLLTMALRGANHFNTRVLYEYLPVVYQKANFFNSKFLVGGSHAAVIIRDMTRFFTPEEIFLIRSTQSVGFHDVFNPAMLGEKEKKIIIKPEDIVALGNCPPQSRSHNNDIIINIFGINIEKAFLEKLKKVGFLSDPVGKSKINFSRLVTYEYLKDGSCEIDIGRNMTTIYRPDLSRFEGKILAFDKLPDADKINEMYVEARDKSRVAVLRVVYRYLIAGNYCAEGDDFWLLYSGNKISGVVVGKLR